MTLQKELNKYKLKENSLEKQNGFVDGFSAAESTYVKASYYIMALGIVIGALITFAFTK